MDNIKNILVGLDLSPTDEALIQYASWLSELLKIERVYFVHNVKKYEISALFKEQLSEVDLESIIGDELTEKVEEHFKSDIPYKVLTAEDSYTESLMSYVVTKYSIDLALIGNKPDDRGTGVITSKLLRVLRCPMLLVSKENPGKLKHIWTGVDFSKHTSWIFECLDYLQEKSGAKVSAAHVYQIPAQFSNYVSLDTMKSKMEKHSKERLEKLIKKMNKSYPIKAQTIDSKEKTVAQNLVDSAEQEQADLLVVGYKGDNNLYSLLVGEVADELTSNYLKMPIWIVK